MTLHDPSAGPVIRPAARTDLMQLVRLLTQLATPDTATDVYDAEPDDVASAFDAIERSAGQSLLVAEEDGRVVGTLHLVIVPNLTHHARPWAVVENVVVDRTRRRTGIGRALLEEAISRAREAGCYKVQLLSRSEREGAHAFYASAGFDPSAAGFRLYLDAPNAAPRLTRN